MTTKNKNSETRETRETRDYINLIIIIILAVLCLSVLCKIYDFLTSNIEYFKAAAFKTSGNDLSNPSMFDKFNQMDRSYQIQIFHLHNSLVKRSVGFITGFSVLLIGFAISFHSIKSLIKVEGEAYDFKTSISTQSPGIIALIVGTAIVMFTIGSKDTFPYNSHSYSPGEKSSSKTDECLSIYNELEQCKKKICEREDELRKKYESKCK